MRLVARQGSLGQHGAAAGVEHGAVAPSGAFLYAALSVSDTVSALSRGADGALLLLAASSFSIGPHVAEVVCSGELLFATDAADTPVMPGSMGVSSFEVGENGAFAVVDGSPVAAGDGPSSLALWRPPLAGDVDGDGTVGILDLLVMLGGWGPCGGACPPSCLADLDHDCSVGVTDLLALLADWG